MINIHHIEGRRSERVAWLLEEIGGVPYELHYIPGDILGSLLKLEEIHESRMAPIVQDGDLVIIESGAILEYLLAKYAKRSSLRPSEDSPDFPNYLQFMHYAEGTAMARILTDRLLHGPLKTAGLNSPLPKLPGVAGARTESERVMYFVENVLAQSRYFAGENFTAADIMMHFPLKLGAPAAAQVAANIAQIQTLDGDYWNAFPRVKDFMFRMSERPAFQRAMKSTMPAGPPNM